MSSSFGKTLVYLCASVVVVVCASGIGGCKSSIEPVEAVISLDMATERLKSATIIVDYSQSGAAPVSSAGHPACTSILPHVETRFADDGQGTLTIEANSEQTFSGPLEVAACRMVPDVAGVAGSTIAAKLRVSLAGGTTVAGTRLDPQRMADARGAYRSPAGSAPGAHSPRAPRPAASPAAAATANTARPGPAASPKAAPGSAAGMRIERDSSARDSSGAGSEQPSAPRAESDDTRGDDAAGSFGGASPGAATGSPLPDSSRPGYDPTDSQPVAEYLVTIGVTSDSGLLGALQFSVNHTGSRGGWQGAGGKVNCNFDAPVGLTTCNDTGRGRLKCALVDVNGFETPAAIVTCVFKTAEGLDASEFAISVEDGTGPDMVPANVVMAIIDLVRR